MTGATLRRVGFTTTFPIEIPMAAGAVPIDLNNLFIGDHPEGWVEVAEAKGFPANLCAWIKGLFALGLQFSGDSVLSDSRLDAIVGITGGDCSNTRSMMDALFAKGIRIIPFGFPHRPEREALIVEMERLMAVFCVDWEQVNAQWEKLKRVRRLLGELDRLTWDGCRVTGKENHRWLVGASDFGGDVKLYHDTLKRFLQSVGQRPEREPCLRLAFLGVPPILTDLYDFLEEQDIEVVFNEIQRQFAMTGKYPDIVSQYLQYTYPYSVFERLDDILPELEKRRVDGIIGYTQSFCHRQIDNLLLRERTGLPFLSLEGDRPGAMDARTRLRLESFLEMIEG